MQNIFPSVPREFYFFASPILVISVASIIAMLQTVMDGFSSRRAVSFTIYSSLVAAIIVVALSFGHNSAVFLGNGFVSDHITRMGMMLSLVISLVVVLLAEGSSHAKRLFVGEVASIYLAAVLGILVMIAAGEMITMFVGLEIASIAIYALVGYMEPSRKSQEGAVKYLVLGSFASGFLLFGMALVYAGSGTMALASIAQGISEGGMSGWTKLGVMMMIAGLGFKLALVPFHMWAPDVYEGSPTILTAFMATASKVMILIFAVRLVGEGFKPANEVWVAALGFLAAASLIGGNIMGLVQSSLKRMLAYSSIAHSGYMAIAVCAIAGKGMEVPVQALIYYVAAYSVMSLGIFSVIMWLETEEASNIQLDDLAGLSQRHPMASFALAVFMFGLAGLPPTVGFMSKFFVFSAAISANLIGLVVIGVIGSSISLYYYLRTIVKMYMSDPHPNQIKLGGGSGGIFAFVAAACVAIVLLSGTIMAGSSYAIFKMKSSANPAAQNQTNAVMIVSNPD
jgi:NADH-quinone oxidoreductase subunit N